MTEAALRRDEDYERINIVDADYPAYRWKVGGRERDGTPTRIGKWTFATKMVRDVVLDAVHGRVLNACAGETKLQKRGCEFVRNDIDESIDADLHVDVREIHHHFEEESFDSAILDPPFDPGRAAKLYEGWHGQEYSHARDAVGQLVRPGGTVVELGWNSYGLADVNDPERPDWERQAWYIYPQASFKGDVHLLVDRRVNQTTLMTDGGRVDSEVGTPRETGLSVAHPDITASEVLDEIDQKAAEIDENGPPEARHRARAIRQYVVILQDGETQ